MLWALFWWQPKQCFFCLSDTESDLDVRDSVDNSLSWQRIALAKGNSMAVSNLDWETTGFN